VSSGAAAGEGHCVVVFESRYLIADRLCDLWLLLHPGVTEISSLKIEIDCSHASLCYSRRGSKHEQCFAVSRQPLSRR
jgi:hypothetical protein